MTNQLVSSAFMTNVIILLRLVETEIMTKSKQIAVNPELCCTQQIKRCRDVINYDSSPFFFS